MNSYPCTHVQGRSTKRLLPFSPGQEGELLEQVHILLVLEQGAVPDVGSALAGRMRNNRRTDEDCASADEFAMPERPTGKQLAKQPRR